MTNRWIVLLGLVILWGCGGPEPVEEAAGVDVATAVEEAVDAVEHTDGPPDLILISIDTFPHYTLGTYGYADGSGVPITPHIDRFAETAHVFEHHVTHAPWTFLSIAALMTSAYPSELGLRNDTGQRLGADALTLAERLGEQGYERRAAVAAPRIYSFFGFDQGFQTFVDMPSDAGAAAMTDRGLEFLAAASGDPLFLWLHYFDPHCPYGLPGAAEESSVPLDCRTGARPPEVYAEMGMTPEKAAVMKKYQDDEIRWMDGELGRFFDHLRETGRFDRSLIILTADHGEEFYTHDHQFVGHGIDLYDTLVRIPLMVKLPGQTTGQRIDQVSRHVDLLPTVFDLLGLATVLDGEPLTGRSIRPLINGESLDLAAYSETNGNVGLLSLRHHGLKFIYGPEGALGPAGHRLYDLRRDPDEQVDLAPERPELVEELMVQLGELRSGRTDRGADESISLPGDLEAELRALGYIQ